MLIDEVVDRASLERYVATTDWPDFLYFWGHTAKDDTIGKQVLSQWWPAPFKIAGMQYTTAEHFVMAEKARTFGDQKTCTEILLAPTASAAKKLGRGVNGYDDAQWAAVRFEVACRGNLAKFSQDPDLRKWLLSTGDVILVEASPVDTIWGIGLSPDDAGAHPEDWKGLNLLGFALMKVRSTLRQEDAFVADALSRIWRPYADLKQTKWINREVLDNGVLAAANLVSRSTYFLSHRSDLQECFDSLIQLLIEPDCYCRRDADVQATADGYARKFEAFREKIVLCECDPQ
jgi:ribA/ribD-fused uncharacterized protein